MLRINDILDKAQGYLTSEELEMIQKAYIYSATVHQGRCVCPGSPTLRIRWRWLHPGRHEDGFRDDHQRLLRYDRDTLTTGEQIQHEFGGDVAFLVSGLMKLSRISCGSQEERQAETSGK